MAPEFLGGRYHSWIIDKDTLPSDITVTCVDDKNEIMALQHNKYQVYGVQFHPESILTPEGDTILSNFLSITK
jgi:anthranilate synthase component 2